MTVEKPTHYPFDLARLVATHLEKTLGRALDEAVLVRLFETLYFASLRTDEGRQTLCTVNFVDGEDPAGGESPSTVANRWIAFPFAHPLPLDVRMLTKLARAADPEAASLNVFADSSGELYVWGMVDQEPRQGDQIVLAAGSDVHRPGLFQATISGSGSICVYRNGTLLGSLVQDVLVEANYDVLWSGPVHALLADHLRVYVDEAHPQLAVECGSPSPAWLERELLLRWLNSLSRILVNVQQYHHGGGLVIVPRVDFDHSNVKYRIRYDRLSSAVVGLGANASAAYSEHGRPDGNGQGRGGRQFVRRAVCSCGRFTSNWSNARRNRSAACAGSPPCPASTALCCWTSVWPSTDSAWNCASTATWTRCSWRATRRPRRLDFGAWR